MIRLTVAELLLIREALAMSAARHEAFCRHQIKKPRKRLYGVNHERTAMRMRDLQAKLTGNNIITADVRTGP
jgi:hypothetical protein